jgi:prepilin-type N-terminal cleavage/methylation domain-containing protein
MIKNRSAFTLVELLIVIAIIGLLATFTLVFLGNTRYKARDTKRKFDIGQVGKFLFLGNCYVPISGFGEYDISVIITELKAIYPQAQMLPMIKDPKTGTDTESMYRYQVTATDKCIIYANLENEEEAITLSEVVAPEAGRGTGVLIGSNTTMIIMTMSH